MRTGPGDRFFNGKGLFPSDLLDRVLIMDTVEYDFSVFTAFRALMAPAFLRAFIVRSFDVRESFDRRSRNFNGFRVVECRLSGFCQLPRISFGPGADGPAVPLIANDISCRDRCQSGGTV